MKKPSPKKQSQGKKKQYKIRNWHDYNEALVNRGKITFWITQKALEEWQEQAKTKKRGRPQAYSNIAIQTALTIQQVFHLALRQTEGFLASILRKVSSVVRAPDYSTLSIRGATLPIEIRVRSFCKEPLHIVVDGTGAKVYGEGEWKVRQHGWGKHRTWKKLHIGVNEATGDILVGEVSGNNTTDGQMLEPLLDQLPADTNIHQVSGDGAYDKRVCYEALRNKEVVRIAIPPQRNAKIWQHGNTKAQRLARDENLRRIRQVGRKRWKQDCNYHRRSLAENTMFRLKTIFTDKVQARTPANQRTQLLLRCRALNLMTTLGMPCAYVVA